MTEIGNVACLTVIMILMAQHKTAIKQWSYHSLVLNHPLMSSKQVRLFTFNRII